MAERTINPDVDDRSCGSCFYWDPEGLREPWRFSITMNRSSLGEDSDEVRRKAIEDLYGVCEKIEDVDEENDFHPPPLAFIHDVSQRYATLHTRVDFGCVLWSSHGRGGV